MTAVRWVVPDNPCRNCWFRPAASGWETCTPCFFRPQRWRVPCSCDPAPLAALLPGVVEVLAETCATTRVNHRTTMPVCPHGRTGHCEDCPNHHNTRERS